MGAHRLPVEYAQVREDALLDVWLASRQRRTRGGGRYGLQ